MRAMILATIVLSSMPVAVAHGQADTDEVERLAPVWRTHDGSAGMIRSLVGGRIVSVSEHGVQLIDPTDGYRGPALDTQIPGSPIGSVGVHGAIVIATDSVVYAIAMPTDDDTAPRLLWKVATDEHETVERIAADDNLVIASVLTRDQRGVSRRRLIAIATTTGAVRWRVPIPTSWMTRALDVHRDHVVLAGTSIATAPAAPTAFARDLDASGATRWTYAGAAANGFAADARFVAIARDDAVVVIDRTTGRAFETAIELSMPDIAIGSGVAYITSRRSANRDGVVVAFGLADHRVRWRHTIDAARTTDVAVARRAIYLQTSADEVVALDRMDGALRWSWGMGAQVELLGDTTAERVLAIDANQMTAFAPVATAPPIEDAVIEGILQGGCINTDGLAVAVDDVTAVGDARGHFRARVRLRGAVSIALGEERLASVELVGHRHYNTGILRFDRCGD